MNTTVIQSLMPRALSRAVTFPEILRTLSEEGVGSYHVDFLRHEARYYGEGEDNLVVSVPFSHGPIPGEFSAERLASINARVQAGEAAFADFVREGTAAGCAYYIVYVAGRKVRYFGRRGGEYVQYLPGADRPAAPAAPPSRSAVKSVDVNAPPSRAFGFLSNPLNWPEYAVVNLKSVTQGEGGWFKAVTKFGEGGLKMSAVPELGTFDHVWKDPQATWDVYGRVVPNGAGCTVLMTLFQPPVMDDAMFDAAMRDMDVELAKLREILERN